MLSDAVVAEIYEVEQVKKKRKRSVKERRERDKKAYGVLISIVCVIFIGTLSIMNLVKTDNKISEQENRSLQQKPEFSLTKLLNGEFSSEYSSYIADQFPGRSFFVNLKTKLELSSGKNESNGVFIGKDDYLIEDFQKGSAQELKSKLDAINQFASQNKSLKTSVMLVPTATKIWQDKLPQNAPVDDELEYLNQVKEKLNKDIQFVNVYDALNKNKDRYIYYKTDHHWTTEGAYIAYVEMCKQLKFTPKSINDYKIERVSNNFYGSLYTKVGVSKGTPDSINVYLPKQDGEVVVNYVDERKKVASLYSNASLDVKDQYQVFTGGNHSLISIKSMADPAKKLLLIKDSYANSFLPFLTANYGEIYVVDLRYYMDNVKQLIKTNGITDVLFLYNVNTFNEDDSILNLAD